MPLPVSLRDVVDELDLQHEEMAVYLNRQTDEIMMVTGEDARLVEEGYDPDDLPEWQRGTMPKIQEVLQSPDYLPMPSQWDLDEYRIMQRFCYDVERDAHREQLLRAISGRGAFRYFKDTLDRLGLREEWYAFRDAAFAEIAARWLDHRDVPYVGDVRTEPAQTDAQPETDRTADCPFCQPEENDRVTVALENEHGYFLLLDHEVLQGSGIVVPKAHRETLFDLTEEEWASTYALLHQARALLDERYAPQGYNVGWNCGEVGGQEVFHAHMHVIPRYEDEPYAGRGIRHWLKQPANRRDEAHR